MQDERPNIPLSARRCVDSESQSKEERIISVTMSPPTGGPDAIDLLRASQVADARWRRPSGCAGPSVLRVRRASGSFAARDIVLHAPDAAACAARRLQTPAVAVPKSGRAKRDDLLWEDWLVEELQWLSQTRLM
jgi:hypothetical protein